VPGIAAHGRRPLSERLLWKEFRAGDTIIVDIGTKETISTGIARSLLS
jgi:hypothetical protein